MSKSPAAEYVPFYARWKWRPKLSLRTLMLLMTFAAIGFVYVVAWPAQRQRRDEAIAAELRSHGARVFFSKRHRPVGSDFLIRLGFSDIYQSVSQVDFVGINFRKEHVQLLAELNGPEAIRIVDSQELDEQTFAALAKLDTVARIDLWGTKFSESNLLQLERLPGLESLSLKDRWSPVAQLDYEALRRVEKRLPIDLNSEIPAAHHAGIYHDNLFGETKKHVFRVESPWFAQVAYNDLSSAREPDGFIDASAPPPGKSLKIRDKFRAMVDFSVQWHVPLQVVDIPGDNDVDDLLPALSQLTSLEELLLPYNQVNGATLQAWRSLTNLRVLNLRNSTEISDADIESILSLQKLEVLNLGAANITPSSAERLLRNLPQLHTLVLPHTVRDKVDIPKNTNVFFADHLLPPRKNEFDRWSIPSEAEQSDQ